MTPEQEAFERRAIWGMYELIKLVRDAGHNDWQTLTSFLANLLLDQDNPHKMLRELHDDVKLKMNLMRDQRRKEAN